jgi:hypothetical protein
MLEAVEVMCEQLGSSSSSSNPGVSSLPSPHLLEALLLLLLLPAAGPPAAVWRSCCHYHSCHYLGWQQQLHEWNP